MIFVTSTRGARAPGGANGDRDGRLSPTPPMAALSPPAVAPRLGGFFMPGGFFRTACIRAVIWREPRRYWIKKSGSGNLDRERPDGQKPHNIVGTFIWAGGFSSVYGLPMRSFLRTARQDCTRLRLRPRSVCLRSFVAPTLYARSPSATARRLGYIIASRPR